MLGLSDAGSGEYGTDTDRSHFDRLAAEFQDVAASQTALIHAAACQGITIEEGVSP